MRKIEQQLRAAWQLGPPLNISNSAVTQNGKEIRLVLFGNVIAERHYDKPGFSFTLAGWNTPTTRSRLKNVLGLDVYNKGKQPYWGDRVISPSEWYAFINS
jgi:hypothetical protein